MIEQEPEHFVDETTQIGILALDPGGTTGWCGTSFALGTLEFISMLGIKALIETDDITVRSGQIEGSANRQVDQIVDLAQRGMSKVDIFVFVIEDFILRQMRKDRSLLSPVHVTEKIDYVNHDRWGHQLFKQQPSLAKSAMPDARLKAMGIYVKGKPHARDGIRHNITFIRRMAQNKKLLESVINWQPYAQST